MLELVEEEYESLPDDPEMQEEFSNIRVRLFHRFYFNRNFPKKLILLIK